MQITTRHRFWFIVFLSLSLLLFFANLWFGSVVLGWKQVLSALFHQPSSGNAAMVIVNQYRLPQAVTALSTGVVLSLSGLILQTLFRNPLAGPSVLGISSGASLGVALVVMSGSIFGFQMAQFPFLGNLTVVMAAFFGALLVLALIIYVSGRVGNVITVLIIGIMVGYAVSAVVSVLQYFTSSDELHTYILWGLGSFSKTTFQQSLFLLATAVAGTLTTLFFVKPLNALLMGSHYAQSIGFRTNRVQTFLILVTGLLVAVGTAFTGPIAFLGLAVPHLARGFFKSSQHGVLIPATVLMGASLALFCNLVAKLPGYDISLPINSVTSLVGAPVIIWVVLRNRHLKTF